MRRSPNGRPLTGARMNDTSALVAKGICPPRGCFELHSAPSPECMVTPVEQGGARPSQDEYCDPSPDRGNTLARARDHLRRM